MNPNLFFLSFVLGTPLALIRLFICLLSGIAAGILVKIFFKGKTFFNFYALKEKEKCNKKKIGIKSFLSDLNKSITITAPYFLIGILLTALFDMYFPEEIIVTLFGENKGLGVLLAASMGIPIYVCGGCTVPLLRVWLQMGMSPGSAIAFMISGPATKITNLGALKVVLGMKNFFLYITFSIIFSSLAGLLTDFIYSIIK